jgi:UDP-N-acetylmuramate--alanine ligase
MLGYVLQELDQDPLVVVGSEVEQLGGNARYGRGKYLVIEADEYQNKLQYYSPQIVILTSADWDHPDFFPDQATYNQVFKDFVARLPQDGLLVAFTDDQNVKEIIKSAKCRVVEYPQRTANSPAMAERTAKLLLPGEHNIWNATAVLTLIKELGLDTTRAAEILATFKGSKRRFELMGEKKGVKVYDDYAHHPVEVRNLLAAAREVFPSNKIWAVFQSHTYTRTKALLKEFGQSFKLADQVIVLPIFGSAREMQGTVSPQDLVAEINKNSGTASYHGTIEEVVKYLVAEVKPGDVVITIGAGENWKVGEGLLNSS